MTFEHWFRSLSWVAAGLVVAATLAFDPWGWAAFGPVKWAVVTTLGFAALALLFAARTFSIHRQSAVGWLAFLGWSAFVGLFAADPIHHWLGTPDRHLGWVAWVLFAVFFVTGQVLGSQDRSLVVPRAASVAVGGIGVYVLFELAGVAPVDLATASQRAGGTFGSPAYLGAASVLLLPLVAGHAADETESARWRAIAGGALALGIVVSIAAQTRAAWVGLLAAGAIALPGMITWIRRHVAVAGSAAALLVVLVLVTPTAGRLAGVFDFEDGSARGRVDEWQVGAAVVGAHPLVGVGFEGYRIAFAEAVDADYEQRYGRAVQPDRAHNGLLDVGVATGVPGLAMYLGAMVWLLMRAVRVGSRTAGWKAGLAAGVGGYIVQQQFLFPLAEVDGVFWLMAGLLVTSSGVALDSRVRVPGGLWLLPTVLTGAALIAGSLDVAADRSAFSALEASRIDSHSIALERADQARELRPDSIRYHFVAATVAAARDTPDGIDAALERIDDALAISQRDPILLAALADARLGLATSLRDPATLALAIDEWQMLVDGDPFNSRYRLQLGVAFRLQGDETRAEQEWLVAVGLAPRDPAALLNLAALYIEQGRVVDALGALDAAAEIDPSDGRVDELRSEITGGS